MVREKCSQHNSITCAVYFRHLTNLLNIYRWLKSCTNKFKLWFLFSQTKWGRCKHSLKMRQENVKRRWFYSESEGWLGSYAKGGRKKSKRTHTHMHRNTLRRSTLSEQWVQTPHVLSVSPSHPLVSPSLPPSHPPSLPVSTPSVITSRAVQFYLHQPLISATAAHRLPIGKDRPRYCLYPVWVK